MTPRRDGRLGVALLAALAAASAALASPPEITARPPKVVLGTDHQVELLVKAEDALRIKSHASTGTLSTAALAAPGAVRFTWTPPDVRYPHTAILLFWSEHGTGPPELAVVRIPLIGRTDLEASTEPKAEVRAEVGDQTFGPRRADAQGHVKIPVEVPPGVTQAKVMSEVGGVSKMVTVPMAVPPTNRLAAVAGPQVLPRSGGWAWLVAAQPFDLKLLKVEAAGAVVTLSSLLPDRALFAVQPLPDARAVSMTFRTDGAPEDLATVGLEVAEPPIAQPHPISNLVLSPATLLGATYGGGANLSVMASVELGVSFPALGTGFAAGLALEGHSMGFTSTVPRNLGTLSSWVVALAPVAQARLQVFELGPAAFHVRAGLGPILFVHQIHSNFEPTWTQSGVSVEVFAGGQVSYRVGPVDLLLDARAAVGPVHTDLLDANIGGMVIGVGARVFR